MFNIVGILGVILFLGGVIALQVFLSGSQSRLPGLVLPGICFIFSLIGGLGALEFSGAIWAFLLLNIPTVVLLGIYYACREKHRVQKQI